MKNISVSSTESNASSFNGIVPESIKNESFNLEENIQSFNENLENQDYDKASNILIDIAKYISIAQHPAQDFINSKFVDTLINILITPYPRAGKFKMFTIHKSSFNILIKLLTKSKELATYLVENSIFNVMSPFLINDDDNFTLYLTLNLFSSIMAYDDQYLESFLNSNILSQLFEIITGFIKKDSSSVAKFENNILQFFSKLISFPKFNDETMVSSILNCFTRIIQHIQPDITTDYDEKLYKSGYDPVLTYFKDIFITSSTALRSLSYNNILFVINSPELLNLINNSLYNIYMNKTWKIILEMDIAILENASEYTEFVQNFIESFNIEILIQNLLKKPQQEYSVGIMNLLCIFINQNESFINNIPIENLFTRILKKSNKLPFHNLQSFVKLCLVIINSNFDGIIPLLFQNELISQFPNVISESPVDLQALSITAFQNYLIKLRSQGNSFDDFVNFLNGEYKDFLVQCCESSQDIADLATQFLEILEE